MSYALNGQRREPVAHFVRSERTGDGARAVLADDQRLSRWGLGVRLVNASFWSSADYFRSSRQPATCHGRPRTSGKLAEGDIVIAEPSTSRSAPWLDATSGHRRVLGLVFTCVDSMSERRAPCQKSPTSSIAPVVVPAAVTVFGSSPT